MKIKKLSKKEINDWLAKQPPLSQFTPEWLKKFQEEVFRKNLQPVKFMKAVKCPECGAVITFPETEILDIQYYVEPYSCSEGDYWKHSKYGCYCWCGKFMEIPDKEIYQAEKFIKITIEQIHERNWNAYHRTPKILYKTVKV